MRLAGRSEEHAFRACLPLSVQYTGATTEVAMKAQDLAHAYVVLDRFIFFRCQESSEFQNVCARIKQHLRDNEGLADFTRLCDLGAEGDELLWLLAGCEGLTGFTRTLEAFGWSAPELTRGLAVIEEAASVIEKIQRHPFGLLARHAGCTSYAHLEANLRSYVALARAARSDFGHGSQWFLNIAKARLVIHVMHRTKGDPRDKEVSGLIAAMTVTEYNADAQRQWRHKHRELFRNPSLDPYTVMGQDRREQVRQSWKQIATQEPEFFREYEKWLADNAALAQFRIGNSPNRKEVKKTC